MTHKRYSATGTAGLALAALFLSACTDLTAYRNLTSSPGAGSRDAIPCTVDKNDRVSGPAACLPGTAAAGRPKPPSLETRTYQGADGRPHDYLMAFVEFDDQGWFWDRDQMNGLVSHLVKDRDKSKQEPGRPPQDYLIITYTHGWRHDARPEDTNVKCFRHLVERFDVIERKLSEAAGHPSRKVVGIYIGWRGLSTEGVAPWELASFWERKSTAERVGHGGVTELLVTLNELRGRWNPDRSRAKTQLVITGHSFGGKVVYSALSQLLVRRSRQIPVDEGNKGFDLETATSFGDLMVLVNPAFEGALYEPLFQSAVNRCYPRWQRPISLIITSYADAATRLTFPMGQTAGNLFEETRPDAGGLQWDTITTTVGHMPRYQTHKLEWIAESKVDAGGESLLEKVSALRARFNLRAEKLADAVGLPEDCLALGSTADFERTFSGDGVFAGLSKYFTAEARPDKEGNGRRMPADNEYRLSKDLAADEAYYGESNGGALVLTRDKGISPRLPYLVVRTEKDVIEDHNKFYTPRFVDFMLRYFVRHIGMKTVPDVDEAAACFHPAGKDAGHCLIPGANICGVSCLVDGRSCSDMVRRKVSFPDR